MTSVLAANALTTLARVKADLGISVSTYDTQLEHLINAVSDIIEERLGRSLGYSTVTETLAGRGSELLNLSRYPLDTAKAITVKHDGTTLESSSYEIHDARAGILRRIGNVWGWDANVASNIAGDPIPGTERKLFEVSYFGGYVLPAGPGTVTLPEDLNLACRVFVTQLYRGLGRDPNITSERLLSAAVTYGSGDGTGMPILSASIIDGYKRIL